MNTTGIVQIPDPVLREVCPLVTTFDDDLRALADELIAATKHAGRAGVAAPQIGVAKNIFAVRLNGDFRVLVNAEILESEGVQRTSEGCLSVGQRWFNLNRAERVRVRATTNEGKPFGGWHEGFDAKLLQHEIDHMSGILVVDRAREQVAGLPRAQRRQLERELAKVPA